MRPLGLGSTLKRIAVIATASRKAHPLHVSSAVAISGNLRDTFCIEKGERRRHSNPTRPRLVVSASQARMPFFHRRAERENPMRRIFALLLVLLPFPVAALEVRV